MPSCAGPPAPGFPADEAALQLLLSTLQQDRVGMGPCPPRREWSISKAQLAVLFGGRFTAAGA